jgi:hypothetical protein
MALNFLKQLRAIEEGGALPSDEILIFAQKPQAQPQTSNSRSHGIYPPPTQQPRKFASMGIVGGRKSKGDVNDDGIDVDSESKDGLNTRGTLKRDVRDRESEILSIVDEPYSNNEAAAHMQHSLSSSMLKQLLSTGSASGGEKPKKTCSAGNTASVAPHTIDSAETRAKSLSMQSKQTMSIDRNVEKGMIALMGLNARDAAGTTTAAAPRKHNEWNDTQSTQAKFGSGLSLADSPASVSGSDGEQGALFNSLLLREVARSGGVRAGTIVNGPTSAQSYMQGLQMYSLSSTASANLPANFDEENSIHSTLSVNSKDSTTKAILRAASDKEKYEREMQAKRSHIQQSMQKHSVIINSSIDASVEFLPTELLIKYGKFELVKERALNKMWKLLVRMRLALLYMSLRQWRAFVYSSNESIRAGAGALIVRIAHGFLGRLKFRKKRAIYLEEERKKGRLNRVKSMGIIQRILLIQCAVRRMLARRVVRPLMRAHRAACFVQLFLRHRMLALAASRLVQRMRVQKEKAIIIQKHFRAFRGRKRFRERRKELSHALIKAKYDTQASMFQWFFEQNGAAAKIQHWFRNLPWYVKRKFTRKYLPYYKARKAIWMDTTGRLAQRKTKKKKKKRVLTGTGKDAGYNAMMLKRVSQTEKMTDIADYIIPLVRGFLSRRRVFRIRTELRRLQALREQCATLLQKTIRRVLVAMRFPLIGTRTRSAQRKYRRWCSSENFRVKVARDALLALVEEKRKLEEETARLKAQSREKSRGGYGNNRNGTSSAQSARALTPPKSAGGGSSKNDQGQETVGGVLTPRGGSSSSSSSRPTTHPNKSNISRPNSKSTRPSSSSAPNKFKKPLVKWWRDADQHVYVSPTEPQRFATGVAKSRARDRCMEDVVSTASDPLLPLHLSVRRNSIDLGSHFKILKAKEIPLMDAAARVIARSYRASVSRSKFTAFMANKKEIYAKKLQRWAIFMTLRRRVVRFRRLIVDEMRLWDRVLRRRAAATIIQRKYKTHVSMVWLRNMRTKRIFGIKQLQRFYRRRIRAKQLRKRQINYRRSLLESRESGQQQYDKTCLCAHIDALWEGAAKIRSLNVPHDLQKYFQASGNGGMMESSRFTKQLANAAKECDIFGGVKKKNKKGKEKAKIKDAEAGAAAAPGVADLEESLEEASVQYGTPLTALMVETMFLKVKALNDKRIDYECFLDLLTNLAAIRFLGLKESVLPNGQQLQDFAKVIKQVDEKAGSGSNGHLSNRERDYEYGLLVEDGVMSQEQIDMVLAINKFSYGRLTGRAALICRFTLQYIAITPEYKKGNNELGKKAADAIAEKLISSAVSVLQTWARNRIGINRILRDWKELAKQKIGKLRIKSAIYIQNMIRGFLGKVRIMRIAQGIYSKYLDEESNAVYWFNPRTEAAFWKKPKLLGTKDCGNPVSMPPADEQFVVMCCLCDPDNNPKSATLFCDDCDDVYCPDCFRIAHKSARMAVHKMIPLTLCVQCDFQAASRNCVQCKDFYCDNCFKTTHARGRLRLHIYEMCTQQCLSCDARAAQWTYHPNDGTALESFYCIPCIRNTFGPTGDARIREFNAKMDEEGQPSLARFKFKGYSVLKFRGDRDEAERKKALADDFARRKAEQHEQKKLRSVTLIQRRWRGFKDRKDVVEFQQKRREFFQLRENQAYLRENPIYNFLAWWGVAPSLASDTTLERVLNGYPRHMHHILRECLNDNWKKAVTLQRQQDEHMENVGNPSMMKVFSARMSASSRSRAYQAAEQKLASKLARLEYRKLQYREARARSDTKKDAIDALKKAAEDSAHQAEKALEAKNRAEDEFKLANQTVTDFVGPRGLHSLVMDRRKNGILMSFRLHMTHGSRIAEVTWEEPPDYAAIAAAKQAAEEAAEQAALEAAKVTVKSNNNKKSKDKAPVIIAAPAVSAEPEIHLSRRELLLKKFQDQNDACAAHLAKRQPVRSLDGLLETDDEGKAVDGFGNVLEIDPATNEPILHPIFEPLPPPDPKQNNPNYGQWVKSLREGDVVLIKGGSYQIRSRADFIQEMAETTRTAEDDAADEKKRKAQEKLEQAEHDPDAYESESDSDEDDAVEIIDEDDIDYQDRKQRKLDLEIMSRKDSDDHICLDRPWVFPDAEFVSISKVIPSLFYMKPIQSIAKSIITSYVPQKIVQFAAINLHKVAKLNGMCSRLFDDESETGAWFRKNESNMNRRKWNLLKHSRQVTHFNFDFKLRRQMWQGIVRRVNNAKKGLMNFMNRAKAAAGDASSQLDFQVWDQSTTKTQVFIYYNLGVHGEENLGSVALDLKAPILLLREYIYRNSEIIEKLNTKFQGENFLFFVVKENENYDGQTGDSAEDWLCMRDAEVATFASDFCPFKIDNKTMMGANRCTIVADVMHPELKKINKRDKHGDIILEPGDEGYEQWIKDHNKKKKKNEVKKVTPPSSPAK